MLHFIATMIVIAVLHLVFLTRLQRDAQILAFVQAAPLWARVITALGYGLGLALILLLVGWGHLAMSVVVPLWSIPLLLTLIVWAVVLFVPTRPSDPLNLLGFVLVIGAVITTLIIWLLYFVVV